jgi:high-affinity Fe2+/Pb2+ permease
MGFVKYLDFSGLGEKEKKALKKLLEGHRKDLEGALKSLTGKKKKAKKKKAKKSKKSKKG